ncbi:apolipoprotein L3-like [Carlito syrichta]|uniref:Apolipoprotein L3-like n=1 Tax=Carlito syrichta TaxID=1868482 RepID=A0A3Q0EDU5_CARSF|nr:apolipoprotein L3-like [Carlito syrichta]
MEDKDRQDRERFLIEFPQVKMKLEESISELHALAGRVDKVHKDCTISNVVAGSTGAVSGILTVLGLALAPVTAGTSLVLSATGVGLGAAAAVTGVSSSIVDYSNRLSAEAKAKNLMATSNDVAKVVKEAVGTNTSKVISLVTKCSRDLQGIEKNIRAFTLVKANPRLVASARSLMTTGRISARSSRQVQKAFGGTALAMTKGVRLVSMATVGISLLMDVVTLVQESVHLHAGAKTKSAEELRQQAQELEKMLEQLTQIYWVSQSGSGFLVVVVVVTAAEWGKTWQVPVLFGAR